MRRLHVYGLTEKAYEPEDINLGFELFSGINQALVKICRGMVSLNDLAHGWSHVVAVAEAGVKIAHHYGLDTRPFLYAALCHDIYSSKDRENHHLLAAEWVRENLEAFGGGVFVEVVARMCEQHRASYTGVYTGLFEEGFAAADRGPVGVEYDVAHYWRSFQYTAARHSEDCLKICERVRKHMLEKFGPDGYARYPSIYQAVFGAELEAYQQRIASRDRMSSVVELLGDAGYINYRWSD